MNFWRTYYHLVWATESRQALITPDLEVELYSYILDEADALGCMIHAIGGVEDHIHLIVSIPPNLSVAEFVRTIKQSSANRLNQTPRTSFSVFSWQTGYGVMTLGSKQLDKAKAYVNHQKVCHANQKTVAGLERVEV